MAFLENKSGALVYMTAPNIKTNHAFTTRYGGVSKGIFSSLNLAVARGDDNNSVLENYQIICSEMGTRPENLVFSRQVHEDAVRIVTSDDCLGDIFASVSYEADGLVTTEKDLPLIIFTADCIPILLHDKNGKCIGACHAGWRGTVMDIAGKTVETMVKASGIKAEDICAAIGPGIGKCCFETGDEVPKAVIDVLGDEGKHYIHRKDKAVVDLKGVNEALLRRAGVENITVSDECTLCNHEKYWSHRYTNGNRGSQASIIVL